MTREEAIHELQEDKRLYETDLCHAGDGSPDGRLLEALDMAIEALSREQKKYDAICDELIELKSDLNLPIEIAMAYEKSIGVVRKYAKMGDSK